MSECWLCRDHRSFHKFDCTPTLTRREICCHPEHASTTARLARHVRAGDVTKWRTFLSGPRGSIHDDIAYISAQYAIREPELFSRCKEATIQSDRSLSPNAIDAEACRILIPGNSAGARSSDEGDNKTKEFTSTVEASQPVTGSRNGRAKEAHQPPK